ncbi:MAG: hypothetical protein K0S44_219 [Bacteroidetes bacterium]|jgi:prophage tail gpP-like protein|nr:hypothetical protein [Bacteroidota bacterium]
MNLKINHRYGANKIVDVAYFNNFTFNLKYGEIASNFGFNFYFDPNDPLHAELACVSHFHEATLEHNGETLLTGFILSQGFNKESQKQLASFGGYSKSGVFADCEIPTDLYPLQSDKLTLKEICERIAAKFHLKVIVDQSAVSQSNGVAKSIKEKADTVIEKSTASEAQNIKSYLTELTTQRNIVLSHDEFGNIVLTAAKTNQKPLFHVGEDEGIPATNISMTFNGQSIHSHITVLTQASSKGGNAGEYTIRNPYCPVAFVYRPKVVTMTSGDDITVEDFAKQVLAAELKDAIKVSVTLDRWDINNKLIKPNNIITLKSRENFIYNTTEFFIDEVSYNGNEKENTCVLTCVLPEVYNGKTPKNIFVNPHENLPRL